MTKKDSVDSILDALAQRLATRNEATPKDAPVPVVAPPRKAKPIASASDKKRIVAKYDRTTIEQLLEAARLSLETYGTITPPAEELLPVMRKTCPHCGENKPVIASEGHDDFGVRVTASGRRRAQPWCRRCRNSKDSHPTRFGKNG